MRWEVTGTNRETGERQVRVVFEATHTAAVQAASERYNLTVDAAAPRDIGAGGDAASPVLWGVRTLRAGNSLPAVAKALFVIAVLLMIAVIVPLISGVASQSAEALAFAVALVIAALSLVVLSYLLDAVGCLTALAGAKEAITNGSAEDAQT